MELFGIFRDFWDSLRSLGTVWDILGLFEVGQSTFDCPRIDFRNNQEIIIAIVDSSNALLAIRVN